SEFSGFLARPALDHNLGFSEKFHGIASLAMKNAEKAFLPSAEREVGHGRGDTDVDADIAGGRLIAEPAGGGAAGGKERSLIAVWAMAQKFHGLVNRIGVDEAEYRAKNFCVGKLAG